MHPACPNNYYYHPNWFSAGNYGYPNRADCNGCCNSTHAPGYTVVPPPPPPSPLYHHHGPYPSYSGVYPPYNGAYAPYHVPPNFFMEQPRYEFDKGVQGRHCCGCPSRHGMGVKNEEERRPPEVLWVPPENLKSRDGTESSEIGSGDGKALEKIRDENLNDNQNNQATPFSFPMFWIPDYPGNKDTEEQPARPKKIIPVKPLYENDDCGVRTNDIQVLPIQESGRKESTAETGEKSVKYNEKGSANKNPRKSWKLPPVCLRVDPLPRRKGCKKTLSPPSGIKPVETKAVATPLEVDGGNLEDHNEKELVSPPPPSQVDVVAGNKTMVAEKVRRSVEAAILIQSFYRGFEVRKWQPRKKLKQIAKVREQADEIRKQIQTLESCSESLRDEKQKVLIGETVMSLLLQLDTIQGLHPTVREIRKGVAKELLSLQERLDSIVSRCSGVEEKPINELKEYDHQLNNDENSTAGIVEELAEIKSKNDSLTEVTERAEEAEHAEQQHPAEVLQDLMEHGTKIEPRIEPSKESEEAGHESSVDMAMSIESKDDSFLEPIKEADEAGRAEPLRNERVQESMDDDSRTEHTKEPQESEHQLQGEEHLPDEEEMSAGKPRDMEAKCHSDLVSPLLDLEDESEAKENAENASVAPKDGLGEPDSTDFVLMEDETDDEAPIEGEAQELSKSLVYGLEESVKDKFMVETEEDSEMQKGTESFKEDEPSEIVVEELPVHVIIDDVPPSYTEENQGPVLQGIEENNTSNDDDPVLSEPVHLEEHQPVCPSAMENIYENDVHCSGETDTYDEVRGVIANVGSLRKDNCEKMMFEAVPDVVEYLDSEIKDTPTEDDSKTETMSCDKGEVPLKLMEENVQLRDLLQKLIKEGKQQLTLVSDLNMRIKSLENKLAKKKKVRMRRHRSTPAVSCVKRS